MVQQKRKNGMIEKKYFFAPETKEQWQSLRLEFLWSEFESVRDFFREKYKREKGVEKWTMSGGYAKHTFGWTEEKLKHLSDIEKKALEKAKRKASAEYALDIEDLLKMKKQAVDLVRIAMAIHQNNSVTKDKNGKTTIKPLAKAPSMRELEKAHRMIRLELGETTEKNELVGQDGAQLVQAPPVVNITVMQPKDERTDRT